MDSAKGLLERLLLKQKEEKSISAMAIDKPGRGGSG